MLGRSGDLQIGSIDKLTSLPFPPQPDRISHAPLPAKAPSVA